MSGGKKERKGAKIINGFSHRWRCMKFSPTDRKNVTARITGKSRYYGKYSDLNIFMNFSMTINICVMKSRTHSLV